jgi:hypothetical protein
MPKSNGDESTPAYQDADDAPSAGRLPPARVRTRSPAAPPTPDHASEAREPGDDGAETPLDPDPATKQDYEVGYGKPPKNTQFKPGQSGNRKGRPKGSRSLATLVDEALSRPIVAKIGGRSIKMSHREAMVRRYVDQAMRGDLKAFAVLLKLDPKAKPSEDDQRDDEAPATLSNEEQAMLLAFLSRTTGQPEDGQ